MAGLAWRAVQTASTCPTSNTALPPGVVATALALPLFQAGFHRTPLRARPIAESTAMSGAMRSAPRGALAFTGASWLVLLLLSELFHLLKIDLLRDLMDEGWFGWTFSGLASGAALGMLRNELKRARHAAAVVMLVLSLLAVPLAVGLALFLVAMVVSGPDVLWDATRSATPVLLACAAGAWVLANAILREDDAG